MPGVKPVLIVAGEGGGIRMVQEEGGQRRFRVFMADQTPTFLDDSDGGGPALHRDSGWLPTWEAAIAYFRTSADGPGRCWFPGRWTLSSQTAFLPP